MVSVLSNSWQQGEICAAVVAHRSITFSLDCVFVSFFPPASCRPLGLRTEDLLWPRRDKMNAGAGLADIDPMAIDQSVSSDHIDCMKAVTVLVCWSHKGPDLEERMSLALPFLSFASVLRWGSTVSEVCQVTSQL